MRASVLSAQATILVLGSIGALGCEQSQAEPSLTQALNELVTAVSVSDWPAVWELTDDEARADLLAVHKELHGALTIVEGVVEANDVPAAKRALGSTLVSDLPVGSDAIGPKLLGRLFVISDIRLDEHARDGLEVASVEEADDVTVVTTIVGEVFRFQRTQTGWRSLLVRDLLERSGLATTYRKRAAAVLEGDRAQRAAWSASQNPKSAHGAYNLARAALQSTPIDAKSLFTFLDTPSRDALVKAIERSRVVQRAVQKRHKGDARVAVYKKKKMWHYVRAGSDRQLYMYWAQEPGFEAPFATRAPPVRVETTEDGARATVHTADGGQVSFIKEKDGYWKLAGQAERLLKLLWEPMDRAYERLARPPEFWKYKDD